MIAIRNGGLRVLLHDEVLGARFEAGSQRERSFPAGCQVVGAPVRKVVEFYRLMGGMAQYALIGGQFEPAPADSLTVRVKVSSPEGREKAFSSDLGTFEYSALHSGLPEYSADYVFDGIVDYHRRQVLPGGVLTIDRAANSELDSAPFAIRHTAALLVAAIAATVRERDVEHALRGWYAPRPGATE
jgi:hypothetical protein